jgi:hypothetical protein
MITEEERAMSKEFMSGSVRQYFTRLSLRGQSRAAIGQWQSLPVDTFFLAMSLPGTLVNRDRRECGAAALSLGVLFANIRWG